MDDAGVQQFLQVTGASEEAAHFFLESAGGDVAAAVDQFFATGGQLDPGQADKAVADAGAVAGQRAQIGAASGSASVPPPVRPAARAAAPRPGGVRSLADLAKSDKDSDEDDRNEYYAGGEKSGQVVQGAPKNKLPEDDVEGLFDRARQAGATAGPAPDQVPASSTSAFSGAAHTLAGGPVAGGAAAPAGPPPPVTHTIAFYANGVFTVDDGEPRSVTDPANRPFLDSVARGECPTELEPLERDQAVSVNLVRREVPYEPPARPRYQAFQGTGRTLAGDDAGPSGSGTAGAAAAGPPASTAGGQPWDGVEEGQPSTSIQLRLADGSRMVARFNLSHTVGDIRRFIHAARPDLPPAYALLNATGFPPKPLPDDGATIEGAGIAGGMVTQKL
ncbi:hypothetical protein WJX81_007147 [Elliptochloris bilobata]|uniref:UBX domain-containing protein n=1 Tax=Elliptochloris bilobata TaxID=381761 RepID=A0AAW1RG56_9CHLO